MHKSGKTETTNTAYTSNRNGQHLIDFMIENRLTCLNTNFQKREVKLWTYTYANNSKAQIDYVFINRKWKNSAMNCEAYSSFEVVSSDHRIVTAKKWLSLRKNAIRTATTKHYDWALLNNRDIRNKYALELRNRFETQITRIISKQLDIKLGLFTKEELDSVLRKSKNREVAGLDEIPPEVWRRHTAPTMQRSLKSK